MHDGSTRVEDFDSFIAQMTPDSLKHALESVGYLPAEGLVTTSFLALRMQRPLLLEGEPGTGKTALAEALAQTLDLPLIRMQCYEGIDSSQALYDWDFARQILHLRTIEAVSGLDGDVKATEEALFDRRFLLERPVLAALQRSPAVLLVDEVDRADDEFEALLLEVLSTYRISIPELGTVAAVVPPIVVLTSNRTRELHDALKRRCLYHWLEHPNLDHEIAIVRSRVPGLRDTLTQQVVALVQKLRLEEDGMPSLLKPPGVAETIDWARSIELLCSSTLDLETAASTMGALVKHREDAHRVQQSLARLMS